MQERGFLNGLSVTPRPEPMSHAAVAVLLTGQSLVFVSDEYSYSWVTSSLISASPELLVCITNPWWSCRSLMLRSPDCTPLPAQSL